MDWFSWLSKTALDPSLIYDYGLLFSQNELVQDDIPYFNHEFLLSMGISIAKHRLEILKFAKKHQKPGRIPPRHMSRILIAIKRTKKCFSNYLRPNWTRRREETALAMVPRRSYSTGWKNALLKRNKSNLPPNNKLSTSSGGQLLITNGTPLFFPSSRINSFSSPFMYDFQDHSKMDDEDFDECWPNAVEEIKWDTMFQDLKPT